MGENRDIMGIEKLDKNNYQPWKFRMRNYLIKKSLWGYVTREEVEPRLPTHNASVDELKAWKTWNEKDKKVMFLISQNVTNEMIGHIQDLNSSRDAWDTLKRLYSTYTKARKIQLKNELNNMKKDTLSVNDYVLKIKQVLDALGSIGAPPEDDDLVFIVLNGLNDDRWKAFATSVYVRETFLDFEDLISLMITEEMRMQGPILGKEGKGWEGEGRADIDMAVFERMEKFLHNKTMAGKCLAKRGGSAFHLHFQGVVRIQAESIIAVNKMIKCYFGWEQSPPIGGVVMCRSLQNVGLHTFHGLLGYCMKDFDVPHFHTIDHNINAIDIQQGVEEYAQHGTEDKQTRVCLTNKNTFKQMAMFWQFNAKHPTMMDYERLLHDMVWSWRYYPSMGWIVGAQGKGDDCGKSNALLRAMVALHLVSRSDISQVFFTDADLNLKSRPRAD
ncbi:hypothetical protein L7F22_044464 [Adiantum nelumboides]|nr:hypothetical protein [Adiantum nelumboides]